MPSFTATDPTPTKYHVEPGLYKLRVENAFEKTSQAGNPMLKVTCRIILDGDQKGPEIWEFLTFTSKAAWKITQFLHGIGKPVAKGETVNIEPIDIVDNEGWAIIGEQESENDTDAKFNKIERWVWGEELARLRSKPAAKQIDDSDEIPF
jgi:hypothetical protein